MRVKSISMFYYQETKEVFVTPLNFFFSFFLKMCCLNHPDAGDGLPYLVSFGCSKSTDVSSLKLWI